MIALNAFHFRVSLSPVYYWPIHHQDVLGKKRLFLLKSKKYFCRTVMDAKLFP